MKKVTLPIPFHTTNRLQIKAIIWLLLTFVLMHLSPIQVKAGIPSGVPEISSPGYDQGVQREIQGRVVDENDNPLEGVSIEIKGGTKGTQTDKDGLFSMEVPDSAILEVTLVGYQSQEITVAGRNFISIHLFILDQQLDEVVVAFGKQKRVDLVGAVTSINPSELKVPSSNLTTALAGRLAGVIAFQRSGEPGQDNASFFIRGVTTFGFKKDPLILIDGVESTTTDLARLQTDEVESFSILKDATATALYGSRAANGVILIKTKEGQRGKAKIFVRVENSVSMPTQNIELADPITYMKLENEAVLTRNPLGVLPYSDEKIENTIAGANPLMFPATDWHRELIKDHTMNQRANLNVSGGGKVARYFIAGSISKDNGILKVDKRNDFNSNIKLITSTLRSNVNVNITKSTELAVRLSGNFDDYTGPINGGSGIYREIMRTNPVRFPAYFPADEAHKYVRHIMFGNYDDGSNNFYLNPYAELEKGYKNYSQSTINAQFQVNQKLDFITQGLSFNILLNTQRYTYFDVTRAYSPFWYQGTSFDRKTDQFQLMLLNEEKGTEYLDYTPGRKTVQSSFYTQSTLNYGHTFNRKHEINGLLVFLTQNRLTGNASDLQSSLPFRNVGLAGRATYSYDRRYNAEFDFGYNASERFSKNHRWGFFPSIGLAWNVSNEKFWEPLEPVITKLKLRGTYGLTGNDDIGSAGDRFLYLSNVNMNDPNRGATFGRDNSYSRTGVSVGRYSNTSITWERSTKANIGMDITLFKDWDIVIDVYKEIRSDILMAREATPAELGLSATPQANIGEAEGKGIDFSVAYKHSFNNSMWLQVLGNFTYAKSKYLKYEEYDYRNEPWKSRIGYSTSQQWGYLAERLFVDDAEALNSPRQNFGDYSGGDIKYRDMNGDGQITTLDQVPLGYPTTPEIVYGFGFSTGYKSFDFSVFFQGLGRESFWINANATAPFVSFLYNNESLPGRPQNQLLKAYAESHWSEDNQDLYALWPRLSTTAAGNNNNSQTSTWLMRNGAFLRLKQLEIGYNLPEKTASRLYMENLRAYVNASNLFSVSNFDLWDVEMGGNGLGYPVQRVINVGIQMNF